MPYRFRPEETVTDGVRRIAREQVLQATTAATKRSQPIAKQVHDARTCCKKLRGLLRLVRPQLGDVYQRENAFFRDAARTLSAMRDLAVVLDLFDEIMSDVEVSRNSIDELRSAITRQSNSQDARGSIEALESVAASMEKHLSDLKDWPIKATGFHAIGDGLAETYQSGRSAMRYAFRTGDTVDWHEWRKHAKYHWYHIRLLRNVWKPAMTARQNELDRLADLLGNEHDLTVLAEKAAGHTAENRETVRLLLERTDERRFAIRNEAGPLGQRIFAEGPKAFKKRMRKYWKVWRHH